MKTYRVNVVEARTYTTSVDIEAESEEQARKAVELAMFYGGGNTDGKEAVAVEALFDAIEEGEWLYWELETREVEDKEVEEVSDVKASHNAVKVLGELELEDD